MTTPRFAAVEVGGQLHHYWAWSFDPPFPVGASVQVVCPTCAMRTYIPTVTIDPEVIFAVIAAHGITHLLQEAETVLS